MYTAWWILNLRNFFLNALTNVKWLVFLIIFFYNIQFQGCRDILRMVLEKSHTIPMVDNVTIMSQINVMMDVSTIVNSNFQ